MRVLILYHPKSDHSGRVVDFARDYKTIKDEDLELLSLETPEGADMAKLYDITNYPALLALREDGQLQKMWQGEQMPPLMNELDYYTKL